jgi:A/G-specific adenine glycosylase
MDFVAELLSWYKKNKRDLPWRNTQNPYKIWLSEVILQQTRVEQGTAYYHTFTERYPDVKKLAQAPETDVLKTWEGLGYYSRARNLHAAAKYITDELDGKFPKTYQEILKLKGVGDYTASAIASICFDEAEPVVDGNVFRFLSRYFGISTPIDSTKGKKEFRALAAELITEKDPGTFNQAMMEFGARQCVPKNPDCSVCVFRLSCYALKKKQVAQLPVKEKKTKVTDRWLNYLIADYKGDFLVRERTGKGIWTGLYEFPLVETEEKTTKKKLGEASFWATKTNLNVAEVKHVSDEIVHKLSHQNLHISFVRGKVKSLKINSTYRVLSASAVNKLPFPIVLRKYWDSFMQERENEE